MSRRISAATAASVARVLVLAAGLVFAAAGHVSAVPVAVGLAFALLLFLDRLRQ